MPAVPSPVAWRVALPVAIAAAWCAAVVAPARAAVPLTVARPLTGFLSQPTEQLSVPGDFTAGEITPQGDLYTGWAEYVPRIGPGLRAFDQPTRVAPNPAEPLYQDQERRGSVRYVLRAFAVGVAGRPVVELTMTAVNLSARRGAARVAMQVQYTVGAERPTSFPGVPASPYRFPRGLGPAGDGRAIVDPGIGFDPGWAYSVDGRDVVRDGQLLMRGPAGPTRPLSLPAAPPTPTTPEAGLDDAATLPGHAEVSWTWQIPLVPSVATPAVDASLDTATLPREYAQFARGWRAAQTGEMTVSLPEPRVDDVLSESLVDILAARDRIPARTDVWFQAVNKFQYQGFWLRDSAIMTVALDEAGLHALAAQNLSSLPDWQQPDGDYLSQPGQQDGVGEALWETAEHVLLTHDVAAAAASVAPVGRALGWIAQDSESQPDGLLAPVSVGDDEFLTDAQVTGDDIWAAVGLRSAISIARLAGRPHLAAVWAALDRRFEAHLDAALSADQRSFGHVTPAIGTSDGDDWGNYQLGYPMAISELRGTEVSRLISWEQAHSSQGLADFAHPGRLHDYLGFPIFETELRRGGPSVAAAVAGLYAETVHTTASGEGWEDGPQAFRTRASIGNLAPHGTFAAQYVSLVHNLLVDDTGERIALLAGVSPAWLAPGDHVVVAGAASDDGPVSLRLVATATGATLRWSLHRFSGASEPLYWALPYWVRSATGPGGVHVRDALALRGNGGSVTLRWTARRPAQSLTDAVNGLNRSYLRRGLPAPLVPASGW